MNRHEVLLNILLTDSYLLSQFIMYILFFMCNVIISRVLFDGIHHLNKNAKREIIALARKNSLADAWQVALFFDVFFCIGDTCNMALSEVVFNIPETVYVW